MGAHQVEPGASERACPRFAGMEVENPDGEDQCVRHIAEVFGHDQATIVL